MKKHIKYFTVWALLAGLFLPVIAQRPGGGGPPRERVEAMRVAFITRRLELTPEEAKTFWPVYDQFQAEMEELRKDGRMKRIEARQNWDELSDKEVEETIDYMIGQKEKELAITRKYHEEFKKVLPMKKVAKLYVAEQQFTRLLLEHLGGNKGGGPGGGRPGGPGGPGRGPMPDGPPMEDGPPVPGGQF